MEIIKNFLQLNRTKDTLKKVFVGWAFFFFGFVVFFKCQECLFVWFALAAGVFNAGMDIVSHHYDQSIFTFKNKPQFYNPEISWTNKYQIGSLHRKKWLGFIPAFVAFTDYWHLQKSLMLTSLSLAIVFYVPLVNWYVDFLIARLAFGITFNLFYKYFFRIGK